jgi:hypothetical protein
VEEFDAPVRVAIRHDIGRVPLKLEELQDAAIRQAPEPKQPEIAMSEGERDGA